MHGLINRSLECFVRDSYGDAVWRGIAAEMALPTERFEPFRRYPDDMAVGVIATAAARLGKPATELLEDFGAWLARTEPTRRLLRFSGSDFTDFIIALEELAGRVAMILPELQMPRIAVEPSLDGRQFRVSVLHALPQWRSVLAGVIRAISDDYGALALIVDEGHAISVDVSDAAFAEARDFVLAADSPAPRAIMR